MRRAFFLCVSSPFLIFPSPVEARDGNEESASSFFLPMRWILFFLVFVLWVNQKKAADPRLPFFPQLRFLFELLSSVTAAPIEIGKY